MKKDKIEQKKQKDNKSKDRSLTQQDLYRIKPELNPDHRR